MDVSLSYVFSKIEDAKRTTIYFGLVKLHNTNAEQTKSWIRKHHLTRNDFLSLFHVVYGDSLAEKELALLAAAEDVRDKVAHGQDWSDAEARTALVSVLQFATALNDFVRARGVTEPFNGDKRGWRGRAPGLPQQTTRWVLKGIATSAAELKLPRRTKPSLAEDVDLRTT